MDKNGEKNMRIRKANPKDCKKIAELRKDTFEKINAIEHTKKQITELNKMNPPEVILKKMRERDMFCLIEKNKILGVIDLEGNKIGGFFIKYKYIRKGYGTILMNFIENYARKKGIKKVILYSTKYAYPFYIKMDYKPSKAFKKDKPFLTKYFSKKLEKYL